MTTSLITGGAGFIGSHLAEFLRARGDRVIVIDDLSTGSLDNLARIRHRPGVQLAIESVLNEMVVDRLVAQADRVFHLAAAVGVDLIVREPARVIETNILGTDSVLRSCARYLRPVFMASTSEVYGKGTAAPFTENQDLILGPTTKSRWSYACSKAIDEFLALAYFHRHHLPVAIGRFFNTTGPRQTGQYGMVIPRFVDQALAGDAITVYGDGNQSRCFAHVRDIVPAVVRLLECPRAYGEVVNLGSPTSITMNALAARVKAKTRSRSPIVHIPFEEAYGQGFEDIQSRQPDIAKARRLIGFAPRYRLDDILADVIRWKKRTRKR
jgi:UDP-glucose 4-epimerase